MSPRVTIFQRRLIGYRVELFDRLRSACADRGIELRVAYGPASPTDAKRNDAAHLAWGDELDARWFSVRGTEMVWQRVPADIRASDLLVMTQENKILSNLPFLARPHTKGRRIAYWGHGRNLQATNPDSASERFKALFTTRVDWWFAYTGHTERILLEQGMPADRITVLANAIDEETFLADLAAVTDDQLAGCRAEADLAVGAPLGLYCGALYADKKLPLLVGAAERLHEADPSFRLVVIGDGPARPELEALIAHHDWAHWVGAQRGVAKAAWFRLASLLLNPGAVGLHILDAFAAGVPLVTTTDDNHGPEIDYLISGTNGLLVDSDRAEVVGRAAVALLTDRDEYQRIVAAALADAKRYTLGAMVDNFASGIEACLSRPPR
ncbi:MAG: glycosyltransferase family 4 protein [Acidimicrobiales bacterium]